MRVIATVALICGAVLSSAATQAQTARVPIPTLPEAEEFALAVSAAPPAIADGASVWLLGKKGYAKVRDGSNGFNCLVERSADDARVRGPQCYDPEASATILPVARRRAELRQQGKTDEEIEAVIAEGFRSGNFRPPARAALGYRLSAGQYLGDRFGRWVSHLRVYVPFITNPDIGGDRRRPEHPFVFGVEGGPHAYIVIPVGYEFKPQS